MAPKRKTKPARKTEASEPRNFYEAVYRVVRKVPKGRVMTYGQIAAILGAPRAARAVGYAMRACPDAIPWQRVINSKGQISARSQVERPVLQKMLLESEGVHFDAMGTCDLERLRWEPRDPDRFYYEGSNHAPF